MDANPDQANVEATKFCNGCRRDVPLDEFFSPKGRKYSRCYPCVRAQNQEYLERNRASMSRRRSDKIKAKRASDPEFREKERLYRKLYNQENPIPQETRLARYRRKSLRYKNDPVFREQVVGQIRGYREVNPEKLIETRRKSYVANKEKYFANNHKRRAKLKGNGGTHTAKEWHDLKVTYGFRCLQCGLAEPEIKLTRDHVIPLVLGGTNSIDNIQPLCLKHNLQKGVKVIDFRPECPSESSGFFPFMSNPD